MEARPRGGTLAIHLAGPGGAGKSTVGPVLAERLDVPFVDLDREFERRFGDISAFIDCHGYSEYIANNIETYRSLIEHAAGEAVLALSSGFMTYARDAVRAPRAFVLLPSLDRDKCVAETVRRQLTRPFARSPETEERVILERFAIYRSLPYDTVETMRPAAAIVEDIVSRLSAFPSGT